MGLQAQAIMHLAASPIQVSLDDTIGRTTDLPFPCHLRTPGNKPILIPSGATISPTTQTGTVLGMKCLLFDIFNSHICGLKLFLLENENRYGLMSLNNL